jgi:hypothetical protein
MHVGRISLGILFLYTGKAETQERPPKLYPKANSFIHASLEYNMVGISLDRRERVKYCRGQWRKRRLFLSTANWMKEELGRQGVIPHR